MRIGDVEPEQVENSSRAGAAADICSEVARQLRLVCMVAPYGSKMEKVTSPNQRAIGAAFPPAQRAGCAPGGVDEVVRQG